MPVGRDKLWQAIADDGSLRVDREGPSHLVGSRMKSRCLVQVQTVSVTIVER